MSMISGLIDELRELATRYDELRVGAVKAVTMPSNMGSILREAADTIWELRDDLQRANAENAKLRERVDAAHMSRLLTENENESLRELAQQMYPKAKAFLQMGVRLGCNDTLSYDWYLQLRNLGVEVD